MEDNPFPFIALDDSAKCQYLKWLKETGLSLKDIVAILFKIDPVKLANSGKDTMPRAVVDEACERIIQHINRFEDEEADDCEYQKWGTRIRTRLEMKKDVYAQCDKEALKRGSKLDPAELNEIADRLAEKEIIPLGGDCYQQLLEGEKWLTIDDANHLRFKEDKLELIARFLGKDMPECKPEGSVSGGEQNQGRGNADKTTGKNETPPKPQMKVDAAPVQSPLKVETPASAEETVASGKGVTEGKEKPGRKSPIPGFIASAEMQVKAKTTSLIDFLPKPALLKAPDIFVNQEMNNLILSLRKQLGPMLDARGMRKSACQRVGNRLVMKWINQELSNHGIKPKSGRPPRKLKKKK